jgi:hypothetical protein
MLLPLPLLLLLPPLLLKPPITSLLPPNASTCQELVVEV